MGPGTINRRRGLRPGQLPARYWRLRYADDIAEQLADNEDEPCWDWYDWYDDDWRERSDSRQVALDRAIAEVCMRIRGSEPLNALPLAAAPRACPLPPRAEAAIEERLVDHIERLTSGSLTDLWPPERATALHALEIIAERHFRDDLAPVLALALFQPFWLRSPASWRPREADELSSLIEHLLLAYPAPRFLYAAAFDLTNLAELRWMAYLIALGQGGSPRRLSELAHRRWADQWAVLPHKLVASLPHVHEQASPQYGLMEAEVLRLGGSVIEQQRLVSDESFAIDPSANELAPDELEFWRTTVGWLVRHRDLIDDAQATMILHWARHMHIERRRIGERFSWRGRTATSVVRDASAYRISLMHAREHWLSWRHHGWDWQGRYAELDWTIVELTNSTQLQDESRAMSHCVRGYDYACSRGGTAIFSLRQTGRRRVTIELAVGSRQVVQAKRACNQQPSALEWAVILRWQAGLQ